MDEVTEGFGKLSTSAKEWVPSSSTFNKVTNSAATATSNTKSESSSLPLSSPAFNEQNNNVLASPTQQQSYHHHQNAAAATMNTSPTLAWKSSSQQQQKQPPPWISSPLQQQSHMHQQKPLIPTTPPTQNSPWNTNAMSPQQHHHLQAQQQAMMTWPEMPSFNSDGINAGHPPSNNNHIAMHSPSPATAKNLVWMSSPPHQHQVPQQLQGAYPPLPHTDSTADAGVTTTTSATTGNGDVTEETTMMSDYPTSIPRLSVSSSNTAPMSSISNIMDPNQIVWWRQFRHMAFTTEQNESWYPRLDVSDPIQKAIPPGFLAIRCLDTTRSSFGYPTTTLHVVSRQDGQPYCLRRVDNVRYTNSAVRMAASVTEQWNPAGISSNEQSLNPAASTVKITPSHSSLVKFFRCFVAHRAFFFLHQYIPWAQTLRERFFSYQQNHHHPVVFLPESTLWSCIVQTFAAVRIVHASNLACRSIQCHHVLCTVSADMMATIASTADQQQQQHELRLYINCTGMLDVLELEGRKPMAELHQEDWNDLGRVLLSLATGIELTRQSSATILQQCLFFISRNFSADFHHLICKLLKEKQKPPANLTNNVSTTTNVPTLKTGYLWQHLEHQIQKSDRLEAALRLEYDSSRVLRLLLKLGFINERPELGRNRQWTESGDCYVLKLFRDYVFHQADESGNPVMDLGHVVTTLNKLDAAVEDEQIVLASRDGKTMLVVTYADVARSLEKAYSELCQNDVSSILASMHHHQQ